MISAARLFTTTLQHCKLYLFTLIGPKQHTHERSGGGPPTHSDAPEQPGRLFTHSTNPRTVQPGCTQGQLHQPQHSAVVQLALHHTPNHVLIGALQGCLYKSNPKELKWPVCKQLSGCRNALDPPTTQLRVQQLNTGGSVVRVGSAKPRGTQNPSPDNHKTTLSALRRAQTPHGLLKPCRQHTRVQGNPWPLHYQHTPDRVYTPGPPVSLAVIEIVTTKAKLPRGFKCTVHRRGCAQDVQEGWQHLSSGLSPTLQPHTQLITTVHPQPSVCTLLSGQKEHCRCHTPISMTGDGGNLENCHDCRPLP